MNQVFYPPDPLQCTLLDVPKRRGHFFIAKAKLRFVLCKSVGLVGIKTLGLVMEGSLGSKVKRRDAKIICIWRY